MKKTFLVGIMFLLLVIIFSFLMKDWTLIVKISGGIGVLSIFISCLLLGVFVSGDRMRANLNSQDKEEREKDLLYTKHILIFGLPNLFAAIIYVLGVYSLV